MSTTNKIEEEGHDEAIANLGKEIDDDEEHVEPPPANSPWKTYFQPQWATMILSRSKLIYLPLVFFKYGMEFAFCVAVVNFYSDIDRTTPCKLVGPLADSGNASAVFDSPLFLLGIYHIIEWIRTTVMLVIVIIGANLMQFWYITSLNFFFGIFCAIWTAVAFFSEDGSACYDVQTYRGQFIMWELILFLVYFLFFHIFQVIFFCQGKERIDAKLRESDEDSDEED